MSEQPLASDPAIPSRGDVRAPQIEVAHMVDEWLRTHIGIPIQVSPFEAGREWCLRRLDGSREPLLVRVSTEALALPGALLLERLQSLAVDAKHNPPDPPGCYLVTGDGLSVRGMIHFEWDIHGQEVRCFVCSRLSTGGDASEERREWRVSVDHVDRGAIDGASLDDDRDTIERMALAHLRSTKGIRIPPPSWTWSVLDVDRVEWWGRLDSAPTGAEVRLVQASTRREKRLPWDPGLRAPTPAELRTLISRIRNPDPGTLK